MRCATLTFSEHALRRMFEREISRQNVRDVVERGEVIPEYPDDRPFPSRLLFGSPEDRPLHVVLAVARENEHGIIVTVYEPETLLWDDDFRRRRKQ